MSDVISKKQMMLTEKVTAVDLCPRCWQDGMRYMGFIAMKTIDAIRLQFADIFAFENGLTSDGRRVLFRQW